ncbi:Flp/Fap pilin component [Rhodoferax ferrireducens T118]|uniref:Flp/Fap pilin component n=2 Tax=Rhodoferax ferrireducens TaxID=192843 RepID=Q220L5_ALBFT|nr:Flp/Fap pilin component [Rhodoferax ferrireducens T118]
MCKRRVLTKVKAMNTSTQSFAEWLIDESGVTAMEYGLLAALIAVTIIGAISATGTSLTTIYDYWSETVIAAL